MAERFDKRVAKRCPVCLKTKALSEWGVRMYHPSGRPYYDPYCRPCMRADQRVRYSMSESTQRHARARSRRHHEAHRRRMANDREYAEAFRAKQRKANRPRPAVVPLKAQDDPMPRLPVRPLVAFVERLVERADEEFEMGQDVRAQRVYESLGIDARTVYAWKHERPTVQFDLVDRVLLNSGALWFDIYDEEMFPEEYRIAERVFDPPLEDAA